MVINAIFILVFLLILLQKAINNVLAQDNNNQCSIGCSYCQDNICKSCEEGFQLSPQYNQCIYSKCDQFLLYQNDQSYSQCVAVCEPTKIPNYTTNICEEQEECSKLFVSENNFSVKVGLKDITIISNDHLLLVYESYYKIIERKTGINYKTIQLENNEVKILVFQSEIYILSYDQEFIKFDILSNKKQVLFKIIDGYFTQNSQLIIINQNIIGISTYSENLKQLFVTPIFEYYQNQQILVHNQYQVLTIEMGSLYSHYLRDNYFIHTQGISIKIEQFQINQTANNQIALKPLVSQFMICQGIIQDNEISQVFDVQNINENNYILIVNSQKQQYFVLNFDISKNSCTSNLLNSYPVKFELINSLDRNQQLIIIQLIESLQIFDINLRLLDTIKISPDQIKTFKPVRQSDKIYKIFILLKSNYLSCYLIDFSEIKIIKIIQFESIQIKIEDPQQVFIDNNSLYPSGLPFNTLFVTNYECQAINQQSQETFFIVSDFLTDTITHKSTISSIQFSQNLLYLVSSSFNGIVNFWQLKNKYEGVRYYSYTQLKESCSSLTMYQEKFVIAQFSTKFIIFDVLNPMNQQEIIVKQGFQTKQVLLLNNNNIALFQQDCVQVIDQFYQQIFNYCRDVILNSQQFLYTSDNYLVLQSPNQISVYLFDFINQQITEKYKYINSQSIVILKMRIFSDQSYSFIFTDTGNSIIQLNNQLSFINQYVIPNLQTTLDISYPFNSDENVFAVSALLSDTTIRQRYYLYKIDFSLNPPLDFFFNKQFGSAIVSFYIQNDNIGNTIYSIQVTAPLTSGSFLIGISILKQTRQNIVGYFDFMNIEIFKQQNCRNGLKMLDQYIGTDSGAIAYAPHYQKSYKNIQKFSNDITNISYDSRQGVYYIISDQVQIRNIHTDLIEDEIAFNNPNEIIQMINSFANRISIFYQSNQIVIKNNRLNQIIKRNNIGLIKGAFIDDVRQVIYIFGNQICSYSFNLELIKLISNSAASLCVFSADQAFCKLNTLNIEAYSLITYQQIFSKQINGLPDTVKMVVDQQQKILYIYNSTIIAMTFDGLLIATLTQSTKPLIEFNLYGNKVMTFSTGNAFVYTRDKLQLVHTFISPGGGNFKFSKYISKYNQVAFTCDLIRNGQVFFYSLTSLEIPIGVTNSLTPIKDEIIGYFFDEANNIGCAADKLGQLFLLNYDTSYGTFNTLSLIQIFSKDQAIFFKENLQNNQILVASKNNLLKVDFNYLTHTFQQFYQENRQKSVKIESKTGKVIYLIVDSLSIIYKYYQYTYQFALSFDDQIVDIQLVPNKELVLIFFKTYIKVFNQNLFVDLNITQKIAHLKQIPIDNYKYYLQEEIIISYDFKLIRYDFLTGNKLFEYSLKNNDQVMCSLLIQIQQMLLIGTQNGKIIQVDLINNIVKELFLVNQSIKQLILASNGTILAFGKDGSIIQIQNLTNTPTYNQIPIQYNLKYDEFEEINFESAYYDEKYQRLYITILQNQRLTILDSNTFVPKSYLSYPTNDQNRFILGYNILILYSEFQVLIYSRETLEYQKSIRQTNRNLKITRAILMQDNYLVVVFLQQVQVYLINNSQNTYQLIDTIVTNYPKILNSSIQSIKQNTDQINIVGYSQTNIFEKTYNVNIYSQNLTTCSAVLDASSYQKAKKEFNLRYQQQTNMKYSFFLNINSTLDVLSAIDQTQAQLILNPYYDSDINNDQGYLDLNLQSFQQIKNNMILKDFHFNFLDKGIYQMSNGTQNITLENITIEYASQKRIQLLMEKQKSIIISNLLIDGKNKRILQDNFENDQTEIYPLFQILNAQSVHIYNLTIQNVELDTLNNLFFFTKIQNVTIKRLQIINSSFYNLIKMINISNLAIEDATIINNSQIGGIQDINPYYLLQTNGILNIQLNNITISQNNNIYFIQTSNHYFYQDQEIILNKDSLKISNLNILNNIYDTYHNQDYSMIQLANNFITINQAEIINNYSNLKILYGVNVLINNSIFSLNKAKNGGGLNALLIKGQLKVSNCKFSLNEAYENGGGIYLNNINSFILDNLSKVSQNKALIGGGIRYTNTKDSSISISLVQSVSQNYAEIIGNNIISFPTKVQIQIEYSGQFVEFIQNSLEIPKDIKLESFQSGGTMNITLKYFDNDGGQLKLSQEKVRNNLYPFSIIQDIQNYNFQVLQNNQVQLSDELAVTYQEFEESYQGLFKKDLIINGVPNQTKVLMLKYQSTANYGFFFINVTINFRSCIRGEIQKKITPQNIICTKSTFGFFSLYDYQNSGKQNSLNEDEIQCKKCPDSAFQCEGDSISLLNEFWRESLYTDEILKCNNNLKACIPQEPNNQFGCQQGYVGPLCEQCDLEGKVWVGKKYSRQTKSNNCLECSELRLQLIYILATIVILLIYLFLSFLMFIDNYTRTQYCYYLRKLSILPFSVTQIRDKSNFYMKILVNYLQISSILISLQIQFIPQILAKAPNLLGQAVSSIAIDTLCLFDQDIVRYQGQGRLQQIVQATIPLLFSFLLLTMLYLFKYLKYFNLKNYHVYTLISFLFMLFQPDSLNLFTKSMKCRKIGSQSYISQDLLYLCDNQEQQLFIKTFTIPNLLIWVICPLIPLYYLYKSRNNLNFCLIKFKLGYFYSDFKQEYYYWEFKRIYLKVCIVLLSTLISESSIIQSLIINITIFFYIIQVIRHNPFITKKMNVLEVASFIHIILLIFIQNLSQQVNEEAFQFVYFLFYYSFIFYMISVILREKMNSENYLGRFLKYILQTMLGQERFKQIFKIKKVTLSSLQKWKIVYNHIHVINKLKAVNVINTTYNIESNQKRRITYEKFNPLFNHTRQIINNSNNGLFKNEVTNISISNNQASPQQDIQLAIIGKTKLEDDTALSLPIEQCSISINQQINCNDYIDLTIDKNPTMSHYQKTNYQQKETFQNQEMNLYNEDINNQSYSNQEYDTSQCENIIKQRVYSFYENKGQNNSHREVINGYKAQQK